MTVGAGRRRWQIRAIVSVLFVRMYENVYQFGFTLMKLLVISIMASFITTFQMKFHCDVLILFVWAFFITIANRIISSDLYLRDKTFVAKTDLCKSLFCLSSSCASRFCSACSASISIGLLFWCPRTIFSWLGQEIILIPVDFFAGSCNLLLHPFIFNVDVSVWVCQ